MIEPKRQHLEMARHILKRKKVVDVLHENLIFTGDIRDRIRRSAVTAIVATALNKNFDNIDLINYVGDTMRGLGCQVVRRYGAYYYRGVRAPDGDEVSDPAES